MLWRLFGLCKIELVVAEMCRICDIFYIFAAEEHKVLRHYETQHKLTLQHFSSLYLYPLPPQYFDQLGGLSVDVNLI